MRRLAKRLREILGTETAPQPEGPALLYNETVIDHFTNPRNVGRMNGGEADGFAIIGDPLCGDQMKLWITVEQGRIADIRFKSFGCPGAIATSSMATALARGRTLQEALDLTDDDVIEALGGIPREQETLLAAGYQRPAPGHQGLPGEKTHARLASQR